MNVMNVASSAPSGWRAELRLRYAARGTRDHSRCSRTLRTVAGAATVLSRAWPSPVGACHTYIVHPPGGVVGGDELQIEVDVDVGSPCAADDACGHEVLSQRWSTGIAGATFQTSAMRHSNGCPRKAFFTATHGCVAQPGRSHRRFEIHRLGDSLPGLAGTRRTLRCRLAGTGSGIVARLAPTVHRPVATRRRAACQGASRGDLAGHHAIGTMLVYPANTALLAQVRAHRVRFVDLLLRRSSMVC